MTETIGPMEGMVLKLTLVVVRRLLRPLGMFHHMLVLLVPIACRNRSLWMATLPHHPPLYTCHLYYYSGHENFAQNQAVLAS